MLIIDSMDRLWLCINKELERTLALQAGMNSN